MKSLQKAQNNRPRLQLRDKDKPKKETPKSTIAASVATLKTAEAVLNRSLQFLI